MAVVGAPERARHIKAALSEAGVPFEHRESVPGARFEGGGWNVDGRRYDALVLTDDGPPSALFGGVFIPDLPTVFYGAAVPERARWIAAHLVGGYLLPPRPEMRRRARRARHFDLEREWTRGERRATRAAFPLPVPAARP